MKIAEFKIRIKGFDFSKEDNGYVPAGLYRDDNKKLFFCVPVAMNAALSGQLDAFVHNANFSDFGLLIETNEAKYNEIDAEINFVQSQFIKFKVNNSSCIHFYIDIVTITYVSSNNHQKASFLLNHAGFGIVQNYYTLSFSCGEEYKMGELKKKYRFILDKSTFHPIFNFGWHESQSEQDISIKKVPFIKSDNFNEDNIISDFECLLQIFRVYYHVDVDYLEGSVYYSDKTQKIYKTIKPTTAEKIEPLNRCLLKKEYNIEYFISNLNIGTLSTYLKEISIIVDSKLTASLLNGKSKFLVLYNAFENIQSLKNNQLDRNRNKDYFINYDAIQKKFLSFLDDILQLVDDGEQEDFKKRWVSSCPKEKYAKSVMQDLMTNLDLDMEEINKLIHKYSNGKYKYLLKLRNDIIHSNDIIFDGVDLDNINRLLSFITTLSLLNILGLENLKLRKFDLSKIYKPNV